MSEWLGLTHPKREDIGMKKIMWWLVLNGGFAAAVWFGFIEGVDGAQYVAKFWVWGAALPMGLVAAFSTSLPKKIAAEPQTPVRSAVQHLIAWFALGVFVWFGHIATAVVWAFWMLAAAICREGVKKHRAGSSSAPAA